MFGDNKKKQPPQSAPVAAEPPPATDDVPAALPQRSTYFKAMRTDAFYNANTVQNFVEFWAAIKTDPVNDKWRIMHYSLYDLDRADGRMDTEVSSKGDVDFVEAVRQLQKFQTLGQEMLSHERVDMETKFPGDKYPVIKVHYHELTDYRRAANIEGIAFDKMDEPYRRVEGKIIVGSSFTRAEVQKSILAVEQARDVPSVVAQIEGGILSDIFATASDRAASLDNILKIAQVLNTMDDFALQVGAFYLSIQRAIGRDDKYDRIEGLQPDEKKDILARAQGLTSVQAGDSQAFPKILQSVVPAMNQSLEAAKALGVHTEPFQKFSAECELYANLLYASQNLKKLEAGFVNTSNSDTNLLTEIRQSVDNAQKKFTELGGSQDQMDKLKAWVANPKKDPIPGWVPGFLTRYYESRARVMQKVQSRSADLVSVETMSVDVKPPITDQSRGAPGGPS
jgi:hypothetical protein